MYKLEVLCMETKYNFTISWRYCAKRYCAIFNCTIFPTDYYKVISIYSNWMWEQLKKDKDPLPNSSLLNFYWALWDDWDPVTFGINKKGKNHFPPIFIAILEISPLYFACWPFSPSKQKYSLNTPYC